MKAVRHNRQGGNARGRREDGLNTKAQILEAAGEVFADKGFDRATGKEIADKAGTNSAAINYYFGGIAGLYEEVLIAAHQRLVSYEALTAIATTPDIDPQGKLRAFLELVVGALATPMPASWAFRVISREILSPSPHIEALKERQLQPKKLLLTRIVADVMGLPPDHPVIATALFQRACTLRHAACRRSPPSRADVSLSRSSLAASAAARGRPAAIFARRIGSARSGIPFETRCRD